MILGFLFFIQTFLKHCKALSTEKYRRYINIYNYYYYYYIQESIEAFSVTTTTHTFENTLVWTGPKCVSLRRW